MTEITPEEQGRTKEGKVYIAQKERRKDGSGSGESSCGTRVSLVGFGSVQLDFDLLIPGLVNFETRTLCKLVQS